VRLVGRRVRRHPVARPSKLRCRCAGDWPNTGSGRPGLPLAGRRGLPAGRAVRPVFAFAVCFSILFWVWYDHYRFFRRYGLADSLELNAYERLATRSEIQSFALNVLVGLASIVIVTVGGPDAAFWSGMAYMLIMPLQTVNGRLMRTRIRRAAATSTQEPAAS
jgi:hypothetical protein